MVKQREIAEKPWRYKIMKNVNYADMANNLLGDELYYKFITEIAKEGKGENLVDFGKEVVEKCCLLIVSLGREVIEISCKEFAAKYEKYSKEIGKNIVETIV